MNVLSPLNTRLASHLAIYHNAITSVINQCKLAMLAADSLYLHHKTTLTLVAPVISCQVSAPAAAWWIIYLLFWLDLNSAATPVAYLYLSWSYNSCKLQGVMT